MLALSLMTLILRVKHAQRIRTCSTLRDQVVTSVWVTKRKLKKVILLWPLLLVSSKDVWLQILQRKKVSPFLLQLHLLFSRPSSEEFQQSKSIKHLWKALSSQAMLHLLKNLYKLTIKASVYHWPFFFFGKKR